MFIYFDPPYYEKGRRLYMNYFSSEDHEKLRNAVSLLDCKWIMTYDDNEKIDELYKNYHRCRFSIDIVLRGERKKGIWQIDVSVFEEAEQLSFFDK